MFAARWMCNQMWNKADQREDCFPKMLADGYKKGHGFHEVWILLLKEISKVRGAKVWYRFRFNAFRN